MPPFEEFKDCMNEICAVFLFDFTKYDSKKTDVLDNHRFLVRYIYYFCIDIISDKLIPLRLSLNENFNK